MLKRIMAFLIMLVLIVFVPIIGFLGYLMTVGDEGHETAWDYVKVGFSLIREAAELAMKGDS